MISKSLLPPGQPMTQGTTDPRGAANATSQRQVTNTMALTGRSGGGKKMKHKKSKNSKNSKTKKTVRWLMGGVGGKLEVPPLAGPGVTPAANNTNKNIASVNANTVSQAEYDNLAGKQGGGSWPKWGCLSGGIKTKKTKKRYKKHSKKSKTRK